MLGSNEMVNVSSATTPVMVSGISNAIGAPAIYNQSCVVIQTGAVQCWGWGSYGQLGDGKATDWRLSPVAVLGVTNATAVAAGGGHTSS